METTTQKPKRKVATFSFVLMILLASIFYYSRLGNDLSLWLFYLWTGINILLMLFLVHLYRIKEVEK